MRSLYGSWDKALRKNKLSLILFIGFNASLLLITALIGNPTILFIVTAVLLIVLSFLPRVKNFLEVLLLVMLVFSIEILYNNFGLIVLLGAAGLVLSLAFMRSFVEGSNDWKYGILKKELLIFISIIFFSLFWGSPALTGYRLFGINFVFGFLIFLITHFTVSSFRSLHFITVLLILVITLNAIYAIYFHMLFGYRAVSLFVETPTYSGHYFVQAIALAIGAYFSPPFQKLRSILLVALTVLLVALFLTLTRAAWLAFFFLVVLSLFFSKIPKRYLIYGGVAVGIVVLAAFFLLSSDTFGIMLKARLATDVQSANVSVGSIAFRILLWQSAWDLFLNNPILGIGFDNFVVLNAMTPSFPIVRALGGADLYVHNIYLEILAETGVVGFFVFILLIVVTYKRLAFMLTHMIWHPYRFLLLGYAGVLSLWFFMGLTEAALYTPVTAIFLFFILGIISGYHKILLCENLINPSRAHLEDNGAR